MRGKVTSKGQITIPVSVREELGLRPGDEVEFVKERGRFHLEKRLLEPSFDRYVGFLKHLEGQDPDEIVEEMRGR